MKSFYRLKKNASYEFVYKRGQSFASREMLLILLKVKGNHILAGFSVSKKIGKAVTRNLVRRRMKESFSRLVGQIVPGHHMVFVARAPAAEADFHTIAKSMRYLLKKAGVYRAQAEPLSEKVRAGGADASPQQE